jgi:hypothetical protein
MLIGSWRATPARSGRGHEPRRADLEIQQPDPLGSQTLATSAGLPAT